VPNFILSFVRISLIDSNNFLLTVEKNIFPEEEKRTIEHQNASDK